MRAPSVQGSRESPGPARGRAGPRWMRGRPRASGSRGGTGGRRSRCARAGPRRACRLAGGAPWPPTGASSWRRAGGRSRAGESSGACGSVDTSDRTDERRRHPSPRVWHPNSAVAGPAGHGPSGSAWALRPHATCGDREHVAAHEAARPNSACSRTDAVGEARADQRLTGQEWCGVVCRREVIGNERQVDRDAA